MTNLKKPTGNSTYPNGGISCSDKKTFKGKSLSINRNSFVSEPIMSQLKIPLYFKVPIWYLNIGYHEL